MRSISLCFRVHHPFHFQLFNTSDVGSNKSYYDDLRIEKEMQEAADSYYLPTNDFLLNLINKDKGKLKLAFYISSTASDQFLMYQPEVLSGFHQLGDTGQVDFLGSTYSHSLVTLTNHKKELTNQIKDHQAKTNYLFGKKPKVFVNSDLMYSDLMGKDIADAGYRAVITNGASKTLAWRSPNFVYSNFYRQKLNVYFRNEAVSDSIAEQLKILSTENNFNTDYTFSIISNIPKEEPLLIIYLDYYLLGGENIDLKQRFLEELIARINNSSQMKLIFPSEIEENYGPVAPITAMEPICWVNGFHPDYFPGNELQREAIRQLYMLLPLANQLDDMNLQKDWQYLQTSDHIHLMDDQHPYYQEETTDDKIYRTKYDAFANFMNILDDFRLKAYRQVRRKDKKQNRNTYKPGSSDEDRSRKTRNLYIEQ